MLNAAPVPVPAGQVIMADKGYNGAWLEEDLNNGGVELIRPGPEKRNSQARQAIPQAPAPADQVGV